MSDPNDASYLTAMECNNDTWYSKTWLIRNSRDQTGFSELRRTFIIQNVFKKLANNLLEN
jgi:hypothetical protein